MITKRHSISAVLVCAGLFVFMIVLRLLLAGSSSSLGRLVFTDFPKPSYQYSVDLFDLEVGKRTPLKIERYQDIGNLSVIDGQHFYLSLCPARGNGLFCSSYTSFIVTPSDTHRFENMTQFWKDDYGSPVW
ncbi:MAG: hypothetical protein ABI970_26915, partial [Chloroflexota bacterium]